VVELLEEGVDVACGAEVDEADVVLGAEVDVVLVFGFLFDLDFEELLKEF
jgi:hypothetical protein